MTVTDPAQALSQVTRRALRLRRSDCAGPGIARKRRGRGFAYFGADGNRLTDEETLARIRELVIPPAWDDVWICMDPRGHLQATGIDAAGRKQYLYHERWRELRDRQKFRLMTDFGERLPRLRRQVDADLGMAAPTRACVLAASIRLLDVGLFRVGSPEYADEDGGLGLSTLQREHVAVQAGVAIFDFPGKSGVRWNRRVDDPECVALLASLRRRRNGPDELLSYRDGRTWRALRATDINAYIKDAVGPPFSAKDFRTWNGTVLAAVALAAATPVPKARTARNRVVAGAVRDVAEALGNTPAVARASYIDPRVVDRYLAGRTIAVPASFAVLSETGRRRRVVERAVLRLLGAHGGR